MGDGTVPKQSKIEDEFLELAAVAEEVTAKVETLKDVLGPVMGPEEPVPEGEKIDEDGLCPLALHIKTARCDIRTVARRLQLLIDRIQL